MSEWKSWGKKNSNPVAVRAWSHCYAQYVPLPHPHNHINPEFFFSEGKVSPPLMFEFIVAFIYTAGLFVFFYLLLLRERINRKVGVQPRFKVCCCCHS